jgi:hypothetical protein
VRACAKAVGVGKIDAGLLEERCGRRELLIFDGEHIVTNRRVKGDECVPAPKRSGGISLFRAVKSSRPEPRTFHAPVRTGAGIDPIATDSTSAVGCSPAVAKLMRLGR